MNIEHIEPRFIAMGSRFKVRITRPSRWTWRTTGTDYAVDIQRDHNGEFFELRVPERLREQLSLLIPQSEPKNRHLLLRVQKAGSRQLDHFLCGHDERHWFAAAVPSHVASVRDAMDALQPKEVDNAVAYHRVPTAQRHKRKNSAFRRQGEWFFIPEPGLKVNEGWILRNEPIRRGRGKPHVVEQLIRKGGHTVWVCGRHPNGLTEPEYREKVRRNPVAATWRWQVMRRDPLAYARGRVRHPDHATITLPCWHRVVMNTESQSGFMRNLAFLD